MKRRVRKQHHERIVWVISAQETIATISHDNPLQFRAFPIRVVQCARGTSNHFIIVGGEIECLDELGAVKVVGQFLFVGIQHLVGTHEIVDVGDGLGGGVVGAVRRGVHCLVHVIYISHDTSKWMIGCRNTTLRFMRRWFGRYWEYVAIYNQQTHHQTSHIKHPLFTMSGHVRFQEYLRYSKCENVNEDESNVVH